MLVARSSSVDSASWISRDLFSRDELQGFNPEKTVENCQILPPVFEFKQHGQSGAWVSEIYPKLAKVADEITFLKSVRTDSAIHSVGEMLWRVAALPGDASPRGLSVWPVGNTAEQIRGRRGPGRASESCSMLVSA